MALAVLSGVKRPTSKCFFFRNLSLEDAEQVSSEAFSVINVFLCYVHYDHCLGNNHLFPKLCELEFTKMLVEKHSDGYTAVHVGSHLIFLPMQFGDYH